MSDEGREFFLPEHGGDREFFPPEHDADREFFLPEHGADREFFPPEHGAGKVFFPPEHGVGKVFALIRIPLLLLVLKLSVQLWAFHLPNTRRRKTPSILKLL